MDDDDKVSVNKVILLGSREGALAALEEMRQTVTRGRGCEHDPLIDIIERNLLAGFNRETPAVIGELVEHFADVLELAQWAGFVDEGASLESLADAFDAYTRDPASEGDDWPSPTAAARTGLTLVAGLIRQARGNLEPKRVSLSDGREISVGIGFNNSAASAALYLVIARAEISGAISARLNSVKAAVDARREAGEPTREKVFKLRDEIKARNPSAKKEAQAWEIAMELDLSFEHVRKMLREPKVDGRIDEMPRHDDGTPRRNDDAL
jgi:hypothetical protein